MMNANPSLLSYSLLLLFRVRNYASTNTETSSDQVSAG